MSWTDEEIDKLFGEASEHQTFEYRQEYWKEFEKQLPVNKSRKPLFWWIAGNVFLAFFVGWTFFEAFQVATVKKDAGSKVAVMPSLVSEERNDQTYTSKEESSTGSDIVKEKEQEQETSLKTKKNDSNSTPFKTEEEMNQESAPIEFLFEAVAEEKEQGKVENNSSLEHDLIPLSVNIASEDKKLLFPIMLVRPLETSYRNSVLIPSTILVEKVNRMKLYAEVNGGIGQAWMIPKEVSRSVNGSIACAAGLSVPVSRINVNIGIGFQATKFDDLKIKERTKVYGFGSSILENTYQFNSIFALTLPLEMNYSMGRHTISLGLTSSWNLFSRLRRTEHLDGMQTADRSGVAKVDLFSKIGLEPTLGYAYAVNENMKIGVRVGMNVIQPIQSDRFIGSPAKSPINGQVYLMRTINF